MKHTDKNKRASTNQNERPRHNASYENTKTMRVIDFTTARTKREKAERFSQFTIAITRILLGWNNEPGEKYPENWRPEQRRRKFKKF